MSSLDCTFLFPNFREVEHYISIGLYLPYFGFGWGGSLRLHWTVPPFWIWMGWTVMSLLDRTSFLDLDGVDRYVFVGPYLLFGWGGSLRFHWTVPSFLWDCLERSVACRSSWLYYNAKKRICQEEK